MGLAGLQNLRILAQSTPPHYPTAQVRGIKPNCLDFKLYDHLQCFSSSTKWVSVQWIVLDIYKTQLLSNSRASKPIDPTTMWLIFHPYSFQIIILSKMERETLRPSCIVLFFSSKIRNSRWISLQNFLIRCSSAYLVLISFKTYLINTSRWGSWFKIKYC